VNQLFSVVYAGHNLVSCLVLSKSVQESFAEFLDAPELALQALYSFSAAFVRWP